MTRYKLIGIYELITGIFGLVLIFLNLSWVIVHKENLNTFFSGIALFGGSIFAGYALMKDYNNAVKYSILLQILQSFSFIVKGYQYLFTSGAFISIVFSNGGISLNSQLGPLSYSISKVSPLQQIQIKIYILPLIFLMVLLLKDKIIMRINKSEESSV
jgi:hypothetical protein